MLAQVLIHTNTDAHAHLHTLVFECTAWYGTYEGEDAKPHCPGPFAFRTNGEGWAVHMRGEFLWSHLLNEWSGSPDGSGLSELPPLVFSVGSAVQCHAAKGDSVAAMHETPC